jgi:hypothetical protein
MRERKRLTRVSSAVFELSTKSSSNTILPLSNSSTIVLPPNLKYPSSSARFTSSPSLLVITVLPTIIAPTQITITLPNSGESIGTNTLTFSPYTSSADRIAMGFTV